MNIGWATCAFAEQVPIYIADAGTARGGPSVNAYKEGLRHELYRNTAVRVLTRCQQQAKDGQSKSTPHSSTLSFLGLSVPWLWLPKSCTDRHTGSLTLRGFRSHTGAKTVLSRSPFASTTRR